MLQYLTDLFSSGHDRAPRGKPVADGLRAERDVSHDFGAVVARAVDGGAEMTAASAPADAAPPDNPAAHAVRDGPATVRGTGRAETGSGPAAAQGAGRGADARGAGLTEVAAPPAPRGGTANAAQPAVGYRHRSGAMPDIAGTGLASAPAGPGMKSPPPRAALAQGAARAGAMSASAGIASTAGPAAGFSRGTSDSAPAPGPAGGAAPAPAGARAGPCRPGSVTRRAGAGGGSCNGPACRGCHAQDQWRDTARRCGHRRGAFFRPRAPCAARHHRRCDRHRR
jgi:hypothetical protein